MCAALIKCQPPIEGKTSNVNRTQCYMRLPQTIYNTTAASSLSQTSRRKCSCKQLDITTSSSSSITSEHFPVKFTLKRESLENRLPMPKIKHRIHQAKEFFFSSNLPKPERLQPPPIRNYCEQFYSCSSEDSDSESCRKITGKRFTKRSKSAKNLVILELLHEVVHLINKDNPIRDEALRITQVAPSSVDDKSSKMTTQTPEIRSERQLPPITPISPLTWPPPPCPCCTYGMTFGQNQLLHMPVIQTYNLMSSTAATPRIPEPFVYETDNSFKDCSSGSKNIKAEIEPDKLHCICSQIEQVCSKHGSLKEMLKKDEEFSKTEAIEPVCTTSREEQKSEALDDYIDEELKPRYVDKEFIDPGNNNNEPSPDSLLKYEDEEPRQAKEPKQEVDEELQPTFAEQIPFYDYERPQDSLMEYDDEDPSIPENVIENSDASNEDLPIFEINEPCLDCLPQYDDEDPSRSDTILENSEAADESLKPDGEPNQVPKLEIDETSQLVTVNENETLPVTETERSPYIVETSATSGGNVYNFLPEINRPDDPKQIIRYQESEEEFDSYYGEEESDLLDDEEYELAKEKLAESRKRKKPDVKEISTMALAEIKQPEGEGSPEEMKFFIDSLIMDFEAMDYARRKSQFEKNICKSKTGMCARDSFPVTITDVTDLGANSLYVKWTIHDCCGIAGYEIYTDGYLTNRYYNSRHEAAVITQVDVTLPHKVALVAQPSADDESLELMCNITKPKNKAKCLPWKTDMEEQNKLRANLWTPSIFLYNPDTRRATTAPPIMRDNF